MKLICKGPRGVYQGFHQWVRIVYARAAVRKQRQVESFVSTPVHYTCTNLAECMENTASGVPGRVHLADGVELGPAAEASRTGACESSIGMGWA